MFLADTGYLTEAVCHAHLAELDLPRLSILPPESCAVFTRGTPPRPRFARFRFRSGMFVTWDKHEHGTESLRGCIGTLTPQAISQLRDYTYSRSAGAEPLA